ncbi:hypothetical protein H1C71_015095 [Ictidomys tridecemlineatus]|nr:hypothetical protein H1C71_015095 [Ictidomys tridecemlineatus]
MPIMPGRKPQYPLGQCTLVSLSMGTNTVVQPLTRGAFPGCVPGAHPCLGLVQTGNGSYPMWPNRSHPMFFVQSTKGAGSAIQRPPMGEAAGSLPTATPHWP